MQAKEEEEEDQKKLREEQQKQWEMIREVHEMLVKSSKTDQVQETN